MDGVEVGRSFAGETGSFVFRISARQLLRSRGLAARPQGTTKTLLDGDDLILVQAEAFIEPSGPGCLTGGHFSRDLGRERATFSVKEVQRPPVEFRYEIAIDIRLAWAARAAAGAFGGISPLFLSAFVSEMSHGELKDLADQHRNFCLPVFLVRGGLLTERATS